MSFSGKHGYVQIDGVALGLVSSWEMDEDEGQTFGAPGDDGSDFITLTIVVNANMVSALGLVRGSYLDLRLSEGGAANYYYELFECRIVSIRYSGASPNKLVSRTVQLETIRPKQVINNAI